jgi:hypothetical protein
MILINPISAQKTASQHYLSCIDEVTNRISIATKFYELAVDPNKKIKKINSFTETFNVSPSSMDYFIKSYFKPKYRKKSKTQVETAGNILNSLFFQGNRYMLNIAKYTAQEKITFLNSINIKTEVILKGLPNELVSFTSDESKKKQQKFKKLLEFIFHYEKLGREKGKAFGKDKTWNTYELTRKLGIKVCPYCNKNWINTVFDEDEGKVTNPQLDHFFPQSEFPVLRLSFYNLIPSCESCNSRIKGELFLPLHKYIHPHYEGFDPEYYFNPIPLDTASSQGVGENYQISLEVKDSSEKFEKVSNSFNFFKIENIYKPHVDIISEIYFKQTKYGLTRIEDLLNNEMFKGMSIQESYRIVFSNYFDEKDFNSRPFSKLTKDTLRSLGLI